MSVFDLYKPFRNKVAELACDDAFYVIWAYAQLLQSVEFDFPKDIEVNQKFIDANPRQTILAEWELEVLAKEVALNAATVAEPDKSLRRWTNLARIVNQLKALENDIYKESREKGNILVELVRKAHRQFPWQINSPNSQSIIRYYKIFARPEIDEIALELLGLTVDELYLCGIGIFGHMMSNPYWRLPIRSMTDAITDEKIIKFLDFVACSLPELRKKLEQEQQYNDKFVYAYNSLRAYPLVELEVDGNATLMCPIPTLLFWKVTNGLYYALVDDRRFSQPFGSSFQDYVGEVCIRACSDEKFKVVGEHEYGPKASRKASIDWMVSEGEAAALFIECKAKRLSWRAKTALEDFAELEVDLQYLAQAIAQTYRTIHGYRAGEYEHVEHLPEMKIYPVIVTLENWFVFGDTMLNPIRVAVERQLAEYKIDPQVLTDMPYSIWATEDVEIALQVINEVGIQDFVEGMVLNPEMKTWNVQSYIQKKYPAHLPTRNLFEDDYDQMLSHFAPDSAAKS